MAQPNSSFDQLASLTISNYSKTLRDNVSANIPLYTFMKDNDGIDDTVDGGVYLLENLDYQANQTVAWYNGFEEISITPSDFATTANFDWKECGGNFVVSERQVAINSGAARQHNLLKSGIKNLEVSLSNNIGAALVNVGTEYSGKSFGGLQYIIADDPTTGIVGGINRATTGNEFWRNQIWDASVEGFTLSATTIIDAMEHLYARCTRGVEHPNLWAYGETYWRYYTGAVNANSRYILGGDKTAKTSYPYYVFKNGTKVFYDPNVGATHGYAINTAYLKLKIHKDRNMNVGKTRYPAQQRAMVIPIDIMANMTCGNCALQGVMHA